MKIVLLDGNVIRSKANVHDAFAAALDLPEYYGRNLDALHDVLTDPGEDIGVIAVNVAALSENLGKWWESLCRVINDAAEEREGLRFLVDPFAVEQ